MAIVVVPTFGADPVTITGPTLDAKVDGLATDYNGNITNDNIATAAAIANSKLNLASIPQDVTLAGTNVLSGATTLSGANTISGITTMSSKILKLAKGADVASAAGNITLGDDGNYFDITGTAAITSITAKAAGTMVTLQTDSTASLVDGGNLKLAGTFQGAAESQITLVSDGTNWFEVSRQPSGYTPTSANALAGSVVQTVKTSYATYASLGTTQFVLDDTTPTWAEGNEVSGLATAITPTSNSNYLIIDVVAHISKTGSAGYCVGIAAFKDPSGTDACLGFETYDVDIFRPEAPTAIRLRYIKTSPGTSATTFKFRIGDDGGDTVVINGKAAATAGRVFGGTLFSSVTITEIKV
jgi:hypothetical protein